MVQAAALTHVHSPIANLSIYWIVPKPEEQSFIEEKKHLGRSLQLFQQCRHGLNAMLARLQERQFLVEILVIFSGCIFSIFNKRTPFSEDEKKLWLTGKKKATSRPVKE